MNLQMLVCALACVGAGGSACARAAPQASERCEAAALRALQALRGAEAREVEFAVSRRQLVTGDGPDAQLRGEGQYRASRGASTPFSYSCAYNLHTGGTSGVVLREQRTLSRTGPLPLMPAELASISPEACESATARTLQEQHPRVGRIVFGSDSRELRATRPGRAVLEGAGAVQPAPGMAAKAFRYRCEIDLSSSRVLQSDVQP